MYTYLLYLKTKDRPVKKKEGSQEDNTHVPVVVYMSTGATCVAAQVNTLLTLKPGVYIYDLQC